MADNEQNETEGGGTKCSPEVKWREAEAIGRRSWEENPLKS